MQALEATARRALATVEPDDTVADAARSMLTGDVRAVVVSRQGRPVGLLTERDIVARVVARQLPLSTPVEVVMTPEPVTLPASASARQAYAALREHRIRHLPLVDGSRVVALLVLDDLVGELIGDLLGGVPEEAHTIEGVPRVYRRCPHCGGGRLQVVNDGRSTNLLCLECRHCWHPEHGSLVRVDPETCPGCPDQLFCRFPLVSS